MRPELEHKLYEDFPSLFSNREQKGSCMVYGCEHGDGWHGILRAACKEITGHGEQECYRPFQFVQIKEKFGTLRLYHDGGDSYCKGVIDMAEAMSAMTCELCGAPGKTNDIGWMSTLCEGCRK
jgi:hypothetical protein